METDAPAVQDAPLEPVAADTQEAATDPAEPEQTPLDDIPEEYREKAQAYLDKREKEMQGDYTKKSQALADVRRKAEFADSILEDKSFAEVLKNLATYGTPTAPKAAAPARLSGEQIILKALEQPEFLGEYIEQEARRIALETVGPMTEKSAAAEASSIVNGLRAKYPDFQEYEDRISDMVDAGDITGTPRSLELAYDALTKGKAATRGIAEGNRLAGNRDRAAVSRSSTAPAVSVPAAKSIMEAYQAALKQHGR